MAGFTTDALGQDTMYADNVDFSGISNPLGQFSANGQILIGSAIAPNIRIGTLTAGSGVSIINSAGSITIGLASSGVVTSILGTANQVTASTSGTVVTLSTSAAFIAPGSITSTTTTTVTSGALTVTAGNAIITAGNLTLPNTNAGASNGIVSFGGTTWISNYGTQNTFVGQASGNSTLTVGSATQNTGLGYSALTSLTTGTLNTAVGAQAMLDIQSGSNNTAVGQNSLEHSVSDSNNTCVGFQSGRAIAGGSTNTCIGYQAGVSFTTGGSNTIIGGSSGTAYTTSESGNIILGEGIAGTIAESNITRIGTGQSKCFISGIDGVNVGSVAKVVTEASNQLGTATITAGTGITITPTANTITIASTNASGFPWTDVTGATQTLAVNNGYVTDHANVTYTLPSTAALGDTIKILGKLGITTIAQNAGQQIIFSSADSTVGVTGSAVGTDESDCVELICSTAGASTVWTAFNFVGNWTIN